MPNILHVETHSLLVSVASKGVKFQSLPQTCVQFRSHFYSLPSNFVSALHRLWPKQAAQSGSREEDNGDAAVLVSWM